MYQVYINKESGETMLAVKLIKRGKFKEGSKKDEWMYQQLPHSLPFSMKGLPKYDDYVVQTDKGNVYVPAEEFNEVFRSQATEVL